MSVYETLRLKWKEILILNQLLDDQVTIQAQSLTPEQALGNPADQDYAILKGKECLTEAIYKGVIGQAYSSNEKSFTGTLSQVLELPLHDSQQMAIFIATINATMRYLGYISGTVHCKNDQPLLCARELPAYIDKYASGFHPKICLVGFQPRMAEVLEANFPLRINDLDKENLGKKVGSVSVEDENTTSCNLEWCDLALVTGTVLTNGTITMFIDKKKVHFYGTTIAGAAYLLGLNRFCPYST